MFSILATFRPGMFWMVSSRFKKILNFSNVAKMRSLLLTLWLKVVFNFQILNSLTMDPWLERMVLGTCAPLEIMSPVSEFDWIRARMENSFQGTRGMFPPSNPNKKCAREREGREFDPDSRQLCIQGFLMIRNSLTPTHQIHDRFPTISLRALLRDWTNDLSVLCHLL